MKIVRASALAACAASALIAVVAACGSFETEPTFVPEGGTDGATASDVAPSSDSAADGDGALSSTECPSKGGAMLRVKPINQKAFCVDITEVTAKAYETFVVETANDTSGQLAACSFNTSFIPSCSFDPNNRPTLPVVCVDWCDAYAFCKWSGKRLCGGINGGATPVNTGPLGNDDQHYAACTSGNVLRGYPYGADYAPGRCNDALHPARKLLEVGSLKDCKTQEGLLDMVGNAYEWIDSCFWSYSTPPTNDGSVGTPDDGCEVQGGSFSEPADAGGSCATHSDFQTRGAQHPDLGFRCCADLP